jgi:prevent-host-death family protein
MYILWGVLYGLGVVTLTVSEARAGFAGALEACLAEPVTIDRHGHPAGVLVSPEVFEKMTEALEELDDIEAFDKAMAEEGPNLPWDEVKAELGWN